MPKSNLYMAVTEILVPERLQPHVVNSLSPREQTAQAASLLRLGRLADALDEALAATESLQAQGDLEGSARALQVLSEIYEARGETGRALVSYKAFHALDISVRLGAREAELAREDAEATPVHGLHDLAWFLARASQLQHRAVSGSGRIALAVVAVNEIAAITAAHGASAAERAVGRAGEIVLHSCRGGDVIARRGNEFLVAFPNADLWTARSACERVRARIVSSDWTDLALGLELGIGFGVAIGSDGGVAGLIERAEQSLARQVMGSPAAK